MRKELSHHTTSARARTAAGSRERGRPRAVPDVFSEKHLRVVSMCACSKKDGSALVAKRRHCTEPLLHLRRHVRLAPLCTGLSRLVVTSTIASTIASCIASTIASRFSWHARDDLLHGNMFCDCGHRELHRLPTSPPRWWLRPQLFDTAVRPCRHSARLEGLPGHVAMGAEDVLSAHGATRDWSPPPVGHDAAIQDQRKTR